MKFTYKPEGADPKVWEYRPNKLMNVEAEKIEDLTGWTYQEFGERFMSGSTKAYHALLYILLKRETPTLKYDQVQFAMDEIEVEFGEVEKAAMLDALREAEASGQLDDDEESMAQLRLLEEELGPKEESTE